MNTEYQIKMDYNNANNTANELENIAASLTFVANSDLNGVLSELKGIWKGENAERFLQKGSIVKNNILSTAKVIRNNAAALREEAKNTYNTEMKALELLKAKRSSEGGGVSGGGGGGSW